LFSYCRGNRPSSIIQTISGTENGGNAEKVAASIRDKLRLDLIDDSRLVCVMLLLINVCIILVVQVYSTDTVLVYVLLSVAFSGIWISYAVTVLYIVNQWYSWLCNSNTTQARAVTLVIPQC
jgi:hypothetical protein